MIRVLHCVAGLGRGGAEKQLALLCQATRDSVDHQIVAAGTERFCYPGLTESLPVVHDAGPASPRDPRTVWRIARVVRQQRPDILHCWLPSMNLAGGLAARLTFPGRPRVVASIRNVDDWKGPVRTFTDRIASRLWDRILCNSQAGLACALRQGLPGEKLHYVPNGIVERDRLTEEARGRLRAKLGVPERGVLLVSACRLVEQKRVDRLLDLVDELRMPFPQIRLAICGDGPWEQRLRAGALAKGLAHHVQFLGALDDPWSLLCAADALVMASVREGSSNTLLEALQAGCAVFATGTGDNAVLVGSEAGWTGEWSELTAALARALESPEMLARFHEAAVVRAREFTVGKMAAETLRHYEELAAAAPRVIAQETPWGQRGQVGNAER